MTFVANSKTDKKYFENKALSLKGTAWQKFKSQSEKKEPEIRL